MQPFLRFLRRTIPDCWLKTVLLFEVGKRQGVKPRTGIR